VGVDDPQVVQGDAPPRLVVGPPGYNKFFLEAFAGFFKFPLVEVQCAQVVKGGPQQVVILQVQGRLPGPQVKLLGLLILALPEQDGPQVRLAVGKGGGAAGFRGLAQVQPQEILALVPLPDDRKNLGLALAQAYGDRSGPPGRRWPARSWSSGIYWLLTKTTSLIIDFLIIYPASVQK
jgi:hypothetical protein